MYLCEYCKKGQLEMCPYFRENFLESGAAVRSCPEFEEDVEEVSLFEFQTLYEGEITER